MRGIRQITGTGIMEGNCIEKEPQAKIVMQGPLSFLASLYAIRDIPNTNDLLRNRSVLSLLAGLAGLCFW
jgi:hypothetical protein